MTLSNKKMTKCVKIVLYTALITRWYIVFIFFFFFLVMNILHYLN